MAEAARSAARDGANVLRAMILCAISDRPMSRDEIEDAVRRATHEFEAGVKADVERALASLQALGTVRPPRDCGGRTVRYERKAV
ncbi:MAG: hypothetical protein C0501_25230 [Isosphaera sp.]|nr:hypothetical protein [Isosphaera sp.]